MILSPNVFAISIVAWSLQSKLTIIGFNCGSFRILRKQHWCLPRKTILSRHTWVTLLCAFEEHVADYKQKQQSVTKHRLSTFQNSIFAKEQLTTERYLPIMERLQQHLLAVVDGLVYLLVKSKQKIKINSSSMCIYFLQTSSSRPADEGKPLMLNNNITLIRKKTPVVMKILLTTVDRIFARLPLSSIVHHLQ